MADFGWSQTSEARNFARLKGVRIVFSTARLEKKIISRLRMEKSFIRKKKCLKTH